MTLRSILAAAHRVHLADHLVVVQAATRGGHHHTLFSSIYHIWPPAIQHGIPKASTCSIGFKAFFQNDDDGIPEEILPPRGSSSSFASRTGWKTTDVSPENDGRSKLE